MCPYVEWFPGKLPICKPINKLCTMCVAGNKGVYKKIKSSEDKNIKKQ